MTLHQFKSLAETKKVNMIWKGGVLIAVRKDSYYDIRLYQLNSFYVEVYHHTHFNVVVKVSSFRNIDKLDPYLKTINITDIYSR